MTTQVLYYSVEQHKCFYDQVPGSVPLTSNEIDMWAGFTLPPTGMRLKPHNYPLEWEPDPNYVSPLEQVRLDKLSEMREACSQAVQQSFTSSATGSEHLYPLSETDFFRILSACFGTGGHVWQDEVLVAITAAQAIDLLEDAKAQIAVHSIRYAELKTYIKDPARTIDEINNTTWS